MILFMKTVDLHQNFNNLGPKEPLYFLERKNLSIRTQCPGIDRKYRSPGWVKNRSFNRKEQKLVS